MRRDSLACLATIGILILAATPVGAQPPAPSLSEAPADEDSGDEDYVVSTAWSDPANCNGAVATRLTFRQVLEAGAALNGRCVAVDGFWQGLALFPRASDAKRKAASSTPALRGRRIGIYAEGALLDRIASRPARYSVVGVIGQCETQWPDALMVLGYCHYTGGPIILVAQATLASEQAATRR